MDGTEPRRGKRTRELSITYLSLKELEPYARNARTHTPAQIVKLRASLAAYGWTNPILIADMGILAGHARVTAAIAMANEGQAIRGNGNPWMAPTVDLSHLTKRERRAYILADNRLAEDAGWDRDLLRIEIEALQACGFDLGLTGFDPQELLGLGTQSGGNTDPDDIPETPATPVSRLGDVWRMGAHRVVCGDSTDANAVAAVLAGATPHLMVTDPPYGVNYDPKWRELSKFLSENYTTRSTAYMDAPADTEANWAKCHALFKGDVAYVWHADVHSIPIGITLMDQGFEIRASIIWAKDRPTINRGPYARQHEPCWYAVRQGKTAHWNGPPMETTLWTIPRIDKDTTRTGHAAQKPMECMRRPIENNSKIGDGVYEPFLGSGTTLIAAEITQRVCYAVELNPAFVDIAVRRWEEFTGKQAILQSDGQTFAQTAASRIPPTPKDDTPNPSPSSPAEDQAQDHSAAAA